MPLAVCLDIKNSALPEGEGEKNLYSLKALCLCVCIFLMGSFPSPPSFLQEFLLKN